MHRIIVTSALCLRALCAQSNNHIDGYVADQTGARIGGATITLRAESTNWRAVTNSAADGTFHFLRPPAGRMELRTELAGFQPSVQTIEVQLRDNPEIAVTLSAASMLQSVEVTGNAAMLQ